MAMELKKGYLKGVSGKFIESPIYNDDLNREQAKAFDENFGELFYIAAHSVETNGVVNT